MKDNTPNKSYSTVLTLVLACIFIFLVNENTYWLYAGLSIGVSSVFSMFVASKIDFIWMKLSFVLSKIVPNILLAIVYFLCLVPIAILSRMFAKKDMMMLKNKSNSLFVNTTENFDKTYFEKPW
ncbi:MAG: hypothetical protein EBQ94_12190 [Flavobacteriales bacterium]|nr:hypothetical protein [Crocinitomicaceae bacterium]NBX81113.1 hypothetical protein [Flavobacteriales bacterium]NCA20076.1 hypothetical protein [Crocinitomicaceae bacterium]